MPPRSRPRPTEPAAVRCHGAALAAPGTRQPAARMSRRSQITMSDQEAAAFLADERTLTCATAGPRGWPT